ncbi:MAG: TadE/TadG family type IV pilus assembly protein [Gemmatimonadota bacterium]
MKQRSRLTSHNALCAFRRRLRDHRGQALVEFVLALPILLVVVFGIIEFASAWRTYQVVTNVAREGARLAVIPTSTDQAVRDRVDSLLVQSGLNLALRTTTLTCAGAAGLCGPLSGGKPDEVRVDYQHTFVVLGPVLDLMCQNCGNGYGTVTLSSVTSMRNE